MKKVLVLIVLFACTSAFAVNLEVWRSKRVELRACDALTGEVLERTGNPTAQEIADYKAGTINVVRFTSNATVFQNACTSWANAATAMNTVCGTLDETLRALAAEYDGETLVNVRGRCGPHEAEIECP